MYSLILLAAALTAADCPQPGIGHPIRTLLAARPHPLRDWWHAHRGTGCAGATAASSACGGATVTTTRTVARTATATATIGTVKMPAPAATAQAMAGGHFIERAAVHRQLRVALRSNNVPPEQRAAMAKAINDPDVYSAAVSKVARDLSRQQTAGVGVIGDGKILELLLANLPAIIAAITSILALFGV